MRKYIKLIFITISIIALLFLLVLSYVLTRPNIEQRVESPEQKLILECNIKENIIQLLIKNKTDKKVIYSLDTGASIYSRWDIKWVNENEIFFSSGDIGNINIFFDGKNWRSSIGK